MAGRPAAASVEMQRTSQPNGEEEKKGVVAGPAAAVAAPAPASSFSGSASSPAALTMDLARLGQYDLLNAAYRKYLSTNLESGQVWYLLALSLMSAQRLDESYLAIRECLTRCADDVHALTLAAHLSLKLRKGKESVEYASRAMRGCKQQMAARSAQVAIESQIAAGGDASSPTELGRLAASLATSSARAAHSSFLPLSHHTQIQSSLLQTCQLLFGVSCSLYAYEVSTFSNRKSLQKRALHALENAYKQQAAIGGDAGVSNKRLVFALACLYADIREIPRALSLAKRALELDRYDVHHWNLLALLLSSQKKYQTALRACEQGLLLVSKSAASPLLLTRAKLQAHLSLFDDAVAGFVDLAHVLFDSSLVHMRAYGIGQRARPTFRPERKTESTEKSENAAIDLTVAAQTEAAEKVATQVETLLAMAEVYAAQGAAIAAAAGVNAPKDDSWLNDAFDAVHYAREIAPTLFLPAIHASLAALASQAGSTALAVRHFESALVLDSHHTASLLGLARLETQRTGGNLVLAYGYLTSVLQVDATNHQAWYEMGMLLQAQGKASAAVEQFITSLELEKTSPISSFAIVPRSVA